MTAVQTLLIQLSDDAGIFILKTVRVLDKALHIFPNQPAQDQFSLIGPVMGI